jgi:hypothetical protein
MSGTAYAHGIGRRGGVKRFADPREEKGAAPVSGRMETGAVPFSDKAKGTVPFSQKREKGTAPVKHIKETRRANRNPA